MCLWGPQISYTLNSFEPKIVLETYYSMDGYWKCGDCQNLYVLGRSHFSLGHIQTKTGIYSGPMTQKRASLHEIIVSMRWSFWSEMSNFYFFLENDPKEGPLDDFSIFLLHKKIVDTPSILAHCQTQPKSKRQLGKALVSSNTPTHLPPGQVLKSWNTSQLN